WKGGGRAWRPLSLPRREEPPRRRSPVQRHERPHGRPWGGQEPVMSDLARVLRLVLGFRPRRHHADPSRLLSRQNRLRPSSGPRALPGAAPAWAGRSCCRCSAPCVTARGDNRSGRNTTKGTYTMKCPVLPAVVFVFLGALLAAIPAPASAQTVSFAPARRDFPAGTAPVSVAAGDFNGDGQLDLAVADNGAKAVSVLLGNGDGTFQAARAFPVGDYPRSVVVGDFNGDGKLDLVLTNPNVDTLSVLLGNGDGTFQDPTTFAAGTSPYSVAVGDFNGDGKLDLAVADRGHPESHIAGAVSVLLGNGDGTFQAPLTFARDNSY